MIICMHGNEDMLGKVIYLIYLFVIGFIYRPHVLTPQSSRQVYESGT